MTKKFKTDKPLPTEHEREVLTILVEEAAEVQQRATKMLRFGAAEIQSGQDLTNSERLSMEIGDFITMVQRAAALDLVSHDFIQRGSKQKELRLAKYMQTEAP